MSHESGVGNGDHDHKHKHKVVSEIVSHGWEGNVSKSQRSVEFDRGSMLVGVSDS